MSFLEMKVKEKKSKETGKSQWEGTVSISGLKPTKVTRKDGSTTFGTKASLMNAAKKVASALKFEGVSTEQPETKKAAKTKATKKKKSSSKSTCSK